MSHGLPSPLSVPWNEEDLETGRRLARRIDARILQRIREHTAEVPHWHGEALRELLREHDEIILQTVAAEIQHQFRMHELEHHSERAGDSIGALVGQIDQAAEATREEQSA